MKTIPFDLSKAKTPENPNGLKVTDGFGHKVRIICTNVKNNHPICAAVQTSLIDKLEYEDIREFREDGTCVFPNYSKHNLLLVVPEPKHVEVWGFIYKANNSWFPFYRTFPTYEDAEDAANQKYYLAAKVVKFHEYDEEAEQ